MDAVRSFNPKTVFEVIGSGMLRDYIAQTPEAKFCQLESGLGDLGKSGWWLLRLGRLGL